ncbi:MAG: hypothetical protein H0U23_17930, partial [Blastocatellia bacterium]|nr:hypothetical protein [Blastocatellia bacterium]
MPISYNPGVVDQSGQILAQGITDFMKRQQEAAREADQLQYQSNKSDMIVGHAYQNKQITPEQWLEYQSMAPKKKVAFGDGLGANMASDMIQQKYRMEQEGQNSLN